MPEDIGDDIRVVLAKLGQLFSDESADADILQPDGIHHPTCGFADAGCRRSCHGLRGESFYDDSAEAIQIYEGSKLDAVSESTAGSDDRIFETEGAYADSEVNSRGPFVNACRLGRTHWRDFITPVKERAQPQRIPPLRILGGLC